MSMVLRAVPVLACGLCMLPCVAMMVFGARRGGRSCHGGADQSDESSETRRASEPKELVGVGDRGDG